jgi:hypothetical protein
MPQRQPLSSCEQSAQSHVAGVYGPIYQFRSVRTALFACKPCKSFLDIQYIITLDIMLLIHEAEWTLLNKFGIRYCVMKFHGLITSVPRKNTLHVSFSAICRWVQDTDKTVH